MDISSALLNTQNPDSNIRQQAESFLNDALQSQMGQFMVTLVQALAAEDFQSVGRQAAGLYLKNILDAKEEALQQQKIRAWMEMDEQLRSVIKEGSLSVLKSNDNMARHTAAQLVAKIGSIELPNQQWPTLLNTLLGNVTGGTNECMQSTLECLGYLCDELDEASLSEDDCNRILTTIVDGMREDRSDPVRYAAVTALRNSLEFVSANFQRKEERDHLLQKVCEATTSSHLRTRVVAYECLATIATLYYDHLEAYMQTLCQLTFKAIETEQHEVSLQALEFWASMCDVEMDIAEEIEYRLEAGTTDQDETLVNHKYVATVVQTLIPLLTNALQQQDDDQDEDTWNISMAGATCLALVAQTVGDPVVDLTMGFINANIELNDWRPKEAAIMAFGSILEGPSSAKLLPLVSQALVFLMGCMQHENILVRDTTAWTLGRICELHASCISAEMLQPLMQLLLEGLHQPPRVSHNICYAIHNIVKAFEASAQAAFMLTPFFGPLFDALLETAARPEALEANLRASAYEALNMLIQVGADNTHVHVMNRLPIILERLEASIQLLLQHPQDDDAVHRLEDPSGLQALLCGVLIAAIQSLNAEITPLADRIMQALLRVFSTHNAAAAEEAFMAAGALANAVGNKFEVYMQYFGPILLAGLQNSEEYMVCSVAVGVVGDLCRALEKGILPLCDDILTALISLLKNPILNRSVKPPVLSCFGDVALAIEGDYDRYVQPTMRMVLQAASACGTVDPNTMDEELIEYMNQLRESVLEALTGIVQGLGSAQKATMLLEFAPQIGGFLATIATDESRTVAVTMGAVGLIGDMAQAMGKAVAELAVQQYVAKLLNECGNSMDNVQGQQLAAWTQKVLSDLQH